MTASSIALSGLQAQSLRLHASAHNVANVLTDDFKSQRTDLAERSQGGVWAFVRRVDTEGPLRFDLVTGEVEGQHSNTDLVHEVVTQITAQRAYEANLAVIEAEMSRLDTLFETIG
jgi:flagellar basal body rod protein FlgG